MISTGDMIKNVVNRHVFIVEDLGTIVLEDEFMTYKNKDGEIISYIKYPVDIQYYIPMGIEGELVWQIKQRTFLSWSTENQQFYKAPVIQSSIESEKQDEVAKSIFSLSFWKNLIWKSK